MKKVIVLALVAIVVAGGGAAWWFTRAKPPAERVVAPFRAAEVDHGRLYERDGVWFMELWGTPLERGKAHGWLVGPVLKEMMPRFIQATIQRDALLDKQKDTLRMMSAMMTEEDITEMSGLADQAGLDWEDLLFLNMTVEVTQGVQCAALAVWGERSQNGSMIVGRNLDWKGGEALLGHDLVIVEQTENGRIIGFGYPGMVGFPTAMNQHGVVGMNLTVERPAGWPGLGTPALHLIRNAIEQGKNFLGAYGFVEGSQRMVPQNYLFADANEALAGEMNAENARYRGRDIPVVAITNYTDEQHGGSKDGRWETLVRSTDAGPMGVEEMKTTMKLTALAESNVASFVFEPAARVVHRATGKPPAAGNEWQRIDLNDVLTKTLAPSPAAPSAR
jgi:hypothetical protein